jgi:hypothetical protein
VGKPRKGEPDINAETRSTLPGGLRCRGERGVAVMSQRWRATQHATVGPAPAGGIMKAAPVLTQTGHKMTA